MNILEIFSQNIPKHLHLIQNQDDHILELMYPELYSGDSPYRVGIITFKRNEYIIKMRADLDSDLPMKYVPLKKFIYNLKCEDGQILQEICNLTLGD